MITLVTPPDHELLLRPPAWARVWAAVFPALFVAIVVSNLRPDEPPVVAIAVGMVAAACLLAWRLFHVAAIGTADGVLVVRNHLRDRELDRSTITEVSIGRLQGGTGNLAVRLALQDGSTLGLAVTEVPFRLFFGRRLERDAAAVRAWVAGQPQPYR